MRKTILVSLVIFSLFLNVPVFASGSMPKAESTDSEIGMKADGSGGADSGRVAADGGGGDVSEASGGGASADAASPDVKEEPAELGTEALFSKQADEGSFFYTVKSGDNLYNIAKRFNTTVDLIMRANGLRNSLIRPGLKLKIYEPEFTIRVDKSENILKLYFDGRLVKTYRVATGENNSTPIGMFFIESKLENPTWFHAGAVVPPESGENILGTRWLGFDLPGYGIHGTTIPESIGTQSTAGCIRMFNRDVEELYSIVPKKTKVEVMN